MNCYLFYNRVWDEFGSGIEGKNLQGIILARNEKSAIWAAKLIKLVYDEMQEVKPMDEDSTMFKL
jgi:hypothetical protein